MYIRPIGISFSPYIRGLSYTVSTLSDYFTLFPVYTGVIVPSGGNSSAKATFPRIYGGYRATVCRMTTSCAFSPYIRGGIAILHCLSRPCRSVPRVAGGYRKSCHGKYLYDSFPREAGVIVILCRSSLSKVAFPREAGVIVYTQ